ncbi:hypothetical protein FRC09_016819, partial [Ceratobasidium sp. 395]
DPPEGGWKLVERKNVNPVANLGRRRSLHSPTVAPVLVSEPETMATAAENLPVSGAPTGGAKVQRAKTVPTQRTTTGDAAAEGKAKRKAKRLDTVAGSVGSTAEAISAGLAREQTKDRGITKEKEKEKEGDESRRVQTQSLGPAEPSTTKEKVV